ncbi:MAG: chemotaxis response regulator protein-glutamate methylesterase [Candidatus Goldbacteria bacterium]|nr:chemotaxis response regulator protein-glutamate methylesterase [Candidatus Goldiibacteriota bacterium]
MEPIKVLVVDDSSFMRKIIPQLLEEDSEIKVIDSARDGMEALKKIQRLRPDVVTLDIEMPGMNGLETLCKIMKDYPMPVIMLSAYTPEGAEITLKALEYGAIDFIRKPSGEISLDIKKVQKELIEKIKIAKTIDLSKLKCITKKEFTIDKSSGLNAEMVKTLVIIAASTGGPRALYEILPKLEKKNFPVSFLVIQHMSSGFTSTLASRLNSISMLNVKEAEDGEEILPETIYIAPGNFHMGIKNINDKIYVLLNQEPAMHGVRPAADMTMVSVAKNFNGSIISVILTGMGKDGTAGAEKIKEKGGRVIAQDKETSVIFGMPRIAIEKGVVDVVAPLQKISEIINVEIEKMLEKK